MLLHDLIVPWGTTNPDQPALRRGDTLLSYAETVEQLRQVASGLVKLGVRLGERVGIYLTKRIEAVLGYFACSFAGAVFVPINSTLKPPQVSHILRDCDVVALITTAAQAKDLNEALRECGHPASGHQSSWTRRRKSRRCRCERRHFKEKIDLIGNIMIDSFELLREKIESSQSPETLGLTNSHCALLTLHRSSNVDYKDSSAAIVNGLEHISSDLRLVFVSHPRTKPSSRL